ncbi:MAG: hypothetical protein L6R40_000666 [Gallowayella cf. fulva]|nr:MAG: hypothetical protein L6R40_000666 [Xanthomendoza cf. fulva]
MSENGGDAVNATAVDNTAKDQSPPQDEPVNQDDGEEVDSQENTAHIPVPSRTIRDLFNPPRNIAAIRQRLFDVAEKIELRKDEFDLYWPYVDNVWVRQHRAGADKTGLYKTDYYACRLQRPTYTPKATDKPRPEGTPTRKKQIREGGKCHMKLKVIRYDGGYQSVIINQLGDKTQHLHDLDQLDKIKRTTVLMEIARSEVMNGYMPASVYTVMSEDEAKLAASGGQHLNRNDVRNASQVWRQQHKQELRVHEGYKYDHGNGIVRQDGAMSLSQRIINSEVVDPTLAYYAELPSNTLRFPEEHRPFLDPYLPQNMAPISEDGLPHVTLTYATSMDSSLSLAPGIQTILSGPHSKAMTHYLRSKHDAILVGVRTALADDPALNCRLEGAGGYGGLGWEGQPRPVVIDPRARWLLTPQTRVIRTVSEGKGRGPWIIIAPGFAMDPNRIEMLKYYGGKYLGLTDFDKRWRLRWEAILRALAAEGIRSVMIEGGGMVVNELLRPEHSNLVSSVIVTVAPTYLGQGGVTISPALSLNADGRPQPALRFKDVTWQSFGEDAVMCGRIPQVEIPVAPPQSMAPVTIAPPPPPPPPPPPQARPVSFFNSSVDAQNGFQPRLPPSS